MHFEAKNLKRINLIIHGEHIAQIVRDKGYSYIELADGLRRKGNLAEEKKIVKGADENIKKEAKWVFDNRKAILDTVSDIMRFINMISGK